MVWIRRDIKDHLITARWTRTFFTSSGCSKLHPAWPWTLPVV